MARKSPPRRCESGSKRFHEAAFNRIPALGLAGPEQSGLASAAIFVPGASNTQNFRIRFQRFERLERFELMEWEQP
jgi:hypothetical protein